MKEVSNERGALPIVVALIVVALLAVAGLAFYNLSSPHKKTASITSSSNSAPSVSVSPASSPTTTTTPIPQSDNDLIVEAARAYNSQSANDTITGITILGDNAKGNGATPGAPSGYEFISHKSSGVWSIVYKGQEQPGKTIGRQYGLPTSWYSTAY